MKTELLILNTHRSLVFNAVFLYIYIFIFIYFIYLAAPGLGFGMQDL